MCIYMLLPLAVLLSGYKLEVMFYGAMAIFTVKLWSVLWFIAQWIDTHLNQAMFPYQSWGAFFMRLADGSPAKKMTLDILLFAMYVGFPLIWSGMMAWAGIRVGTALSGLMEKNAHPGGEMTAPGVANRVNAVKGLGK
jgi:hypothetical protein